VKTSEANLEFSYDSRNRAEVARDSGNIVDICSTVLRSAVRDSRLFQSKKQSAAPQLASSFLFEQTQRSPQQSEISEVRSAGSDRPRKNRPKAAFHAK
jgi:hypothetical protein